MVIELPINQSNPIRVGDEEALSRRKPILHNGPISLFFSGMSCYIIVLRQSTFIGLYTGSHEAWKLFRGGAYR